MKANAEANEEDRIPDAELLGHMGYVYCPDACGTPRSLSNVRTFIFAGHDTTTSAISRTLHQLALYPEIQSRLREEVTAACKKHGDLDYDTLMTLPYLDAVCRETLRVFPPVPQLSRTYVSSSPSII